MTPSKSMSPITGCTLNPLATGTADLATPEPQLARRDFGSDSARREQLSARFAGGQAARAEVRAGSRPGVNADLGPCPTLDLALEALAAQLGPHVPVAAGQGTQLALGLTLSPRTPSGFGVDLGLRLQGAMNREGKLTLSARLELLLLAVYEVPGLSLKAGAAFAGGVTATGDDLGECLQLLAAALLLQAEGADPALAALLVEDPAELQARAREGLSVAGGEADGVRTSGELSGVGAFSAGGAGGEVDGELRVGKNRTQGFAAAPGGGVVPVDEEQTQMSASLSVALGSAEWSFSMDANLSNGEITLGGTGGFDVPGRVRLGQAAQDAARAVEDAAEDAAGLVEAADPGHAAAERLREGARAAAAAGYGAAIAGEAADLELAATLRLAKKEGHLEVRVIGSSAGGLEGGGPEPELPGGGKKAGHLGVSVDAKLSRTQRLIQARFPLAPPAHQEQGRRAQGFGGYMPEE